MTEIVHDPFSGNADNLRKLIEGAKVYAVKYPDQFNMRYYNGFMGARPSRAPQNISDCGTTACFLGIGPTISTLRADEDEYWEEYASRVIGVDSTMADWLWLFSGDWAYELPTLHQMVEGVIVATDYPIDRELTNTIEHAIARAEYALAVGIPSDAEEQTLGKTFPSYLEYVKELPNG